MRPAYLLTGVGILLAFWAVAGKPTGQTEVQAISIKRARPPQPVKDILPTIRNSLSVQEIGVLGAELRAMLRDRLAEELERPHVNRGMVRLIVPSLAKLGDRNAEEMILAGLQSESAANRSQAILDAGFARTPALISALGDMLFSEAPYDRHGDVILCAPSLAAARILATIVENPPVPPIGHEKKLYTNEDVRIWRDWWKSKEGIVVDDVYERSSNIVYPKHPQ